METPIEVKKGVHPPLSAMTAQPVMFDDERQSLLLVYPLVNSYMKPIGTR